MYGLVDCNNFFVSCERVFRPDLEYKPVIVLSNNDGCAVARSQEVKDLGVKMGAPYFKIQHIIKENNVRVFSSNFKLYGDISKRIMRILTNFMPSVEIYSIDEAFLDFTTLYTKKNLRLYSQEILDFIKQVTGIPVSIGIAKTKTLTKIANAYAKANRRFNRITDLSNVTELHLNAILKQVPIEHIWGIGQNKSTFLKKHGVYTAYDLKIQNQTWIRKQLSVLGEKTYLELHSIPCFTLDSNPVPKKGIASTRSFGKYIHKKSELIEAISEYTANACRKLRKQNSVAKSITVYLRTNKHNKSHKQYSNAITIDLEEPSQYTPTFISAAVKGLHFIFKENHLYQKAGIYLTRISPSDSYTKHLFMSKTEEHIQKENNIMSIMDKHNQKWGRALIHTASQGTKHIWQVKAKKRSQNYTTSWSELLTIQI